MQIFLYASSVCQLSSLIKVPFPLSLLYLLQYWDILLSQVWHAETWNPYSLPNITKLEYSFYTKCNRQKHQNPYPKSCFFLCSSICFLCTSKSSSSHCSFSNSSCSFFNISVCNYRHIISVQPFWLWFFNRLPFFSLSYYSQLQIRHFFLKKKKKYCNFSMKTYIVVLIRSASAGLF